MQESEAGNAVTEQHDGDGLMSRVVSFADWVAARTASPLRGAERASEAASARAVARRIEYLHRLLWESGLRHPLGAAEVRPLVACLSVEFGDTDEG